MNIKKRSATVVETDDVFQARRAVWDAYAEAWSAVSAGEQEKLLAQSVTPDCDYADPNVERRGRTQLTSYIEQFQKNLPGGSFRTERCRLHHDHGLVEWKQINSQGKSVGAGSDVLRFNADHLIISVTGFFDKL